MMRLTYQRPPPAICAVLLLVILVVLAQISAAVVATSGCIGLIGFLVARVACGPRSLRGVLV